MSVLQLARPEIVAMKPYSSARSEASGRGLLLNANESPWALIEQPTLRAEEVGSLNRYPAPQPAELVERAAQEYGVRPEQVLLTRGSDEAIDVLVRVFCRANRDAILDCPPSFGMYAIAARIQSADIIEVPRIADSLALDKPAILKRVARERALRIVFLTSPSNPTGDLIEEGFLREVLVLADGRCIIVVDEAYIEFTDAPSAARLVDANPQLVVLRTLSKAFGSAGLRCGVTLANPEVIGLMRRVVAPYPLPSPIVALALQLFRPDMKRRQGLMLREIAANKAKLLETVAGRSFVRRIWPGEANFILLRVDDAVGLVTHCAAMGIAIRRFAHDPHLDNCVRITVGSQKEIEALAAALDGYAESASEAADG